MGTYMGSQNQYPNVWNKCAQLKWEEGYKHSHLKDKRYVECRVYFVINSLCREERYKSQITTGIHLQRIAGMNGSI